jgi:hypothetical protein
MSVSNFACDAVQRSGGSIPSYLFAPAPGGRVEEVGSQNSSSISGVIVASGAAVDISGAIPFAGNGIYLIAAICPGTPAYNVSAVVSFFDEAGAAPVCVGGGTTVVATGSAPPNPLFTSAIVATGGIPTLTQNSGGPLTFNILALRLATVVPGV